MKLRKYVLHLLIIYELFEPCVLHQWNAIHTGNWHTDALHQ